MADRKTDDICPKCGRFVSSCEYHKDDPPDPIRAAAEETNNRIGEILRTAPFTDEPLETITCCIEQALRAMVERECLDALCEGCKLGLKEDPKWCLCRGCLRLGYILDRIRQGGK